MLVRRQRSTHAADAARRRAADGRAGSARRGGLRTREAVLRACSKRLSRSRVGVLTGYDEEDNCVSEVLLLVRDLGTLYRGWRYRDSTVRGAMPRFLSARGGVLARRLEESGKGSNTPHPPLATCE
eukprot:364344-Chlamydomonas_euryale.AAC.13